jgi:hypothetical protein
MSFLTVIVFQIIKNINDELVYSLRRLIFFFKNVDTLKVLALNCGKIIFKIIFLNYNTWQAI